MQQVSFKLLIKFKRQTLKKKINFFLNYLKTGGRSLRHNSSSTDQPTVCWPQVISLVGDIKKTWVVNKQGVLPTFWFNGTLKTLFFHPSNQMGEIIFDLRCSIILYLVTFFNKQSRLKIPSGWNKSDIQWLSKQH